MSAAPFWDPFVHTSCFKEKVWRFRQQDRCTATSYSRVDLQRYAFVRGQKDRCVFRSTKTGIILLHHIDDIRAAGPEQALAQLFEKELPRHCEVQAGELEREGTAVEYLGRTKIRTSDAIITVPDERQRASPQRTVVRFLRNNSTS